MYNSKVILPLLVSVGSLRASLQGGTPLGPCRFGLWAPSVSFGYILYLTKQYNKQVQVLGLDRKHFY